MPDVVQFPAGEALDRLRALCLALPGVTERLSHGEPAWFVGPPGRPGRPGLRGRHQTQLGADGDPVTQEPDRRRAARQFVTLADHHHDDRFGFWAAAPDGAQARWLAVGDGRFFRPPYVGGRGWIGVYLDVALDWDDVAEIVADAHAVAAPKRRSARQP